MWDNMEMRVKASYPDRAADRTGRLREKRVERYKYNQSTSS